MNVFFCNYTSVNPYKEFYGSSNNFRPTETFPVNKVTFVTYRTIVSVYVNYSHFPVQLDMAVLYDAVFLLSEGLNTLNARNNENEDYLSIDPEPLSCDDDRKYYQAGPNITSIMREVKHPTLSFYLFFFVVFFSSFCKRMYARNV